MKKVMVSIIVLLCISACGFGGSNNETVYECKVKAGNSINSVSYIYEQNGRVTKIITEIFFGGYTKNTIESEIRYYEEKLQENTTPSVTIRYEKADDTTIKMINDIDVNDEYIAYLQEKGRVFTDKSGKEVDYIPIDWELNFQQVDWNSECKVID